MDFAESTKYLYSLGNEVSAMKLGLENIRKLLAALGCPQNSFLKVQIAGTNGKGSVCAFLDSICNTAGIKTGTFMSPHLVSITERIRINGSDIGEEDFARCAEHVRKTAEQLLVCGGLEYRPTFFEQITAIALIAFADAGVELAILETGLGGRLDATTAANAEIAVITRIDLDHQEYLGNTIEEIAAEKAAIIHAGSMVITGEQLPEAVNVIQQRCSALGITPKIECDAHIWAIDTLNRSPVVMFRTTNDVYNDSSLGIRGRHQIENARIAVLLTDVLRFNCGFMIDSGDVAEALESARHPGRLEYCGRYLFDGAHNIGGARALTAYLDEFERRPITMIFGAMRGKDVVEMLHILFPRCAKIVLTQPENSRALSCEELLETLPLDLRKQNIFVTDRVSSAIDIAKTVTPVDGIILVTGSLYLVGEVKKNLPSQI